MLLRPLDRRKFSARFRPQNDRNTKLDSFNTIVEACLIIKEHFELTFICLNLQSYIEMVVNFNIYICKIKVGKVTLKKVYNILTFAFLAFPDTLFFLASMKLCLFTLP